MLYQFFIFIEMVLQIMFHVLCMLILILRHEVLEALLLWRNCTFGDITVHETTSAYKATFKINLCYHNFIFPIPIYYPSLTLIDSWFIAVDLWHDLQKLLRRICFCRKSHLLSQPSQKLKNLSGNWSLWMNVWIKQIIIIMYP